MYKRLYYMLNAITAACIVVFYTVVFDFCDNSRQTHEHFRVVNGGMIACAMRLGCITQLDVVFAMRLQPVVYP